MAIIKRQEHAEWYEKKYELNYYNVRNTAWDFLLVNHVENFPLDLNKIMKENHWKHFSYSTYSKLTGKTKTELLLNSKDGFTDVDNNDHYVIVTNENQSTQRRRFTVAHEIGHIVLHKVFKDEKKLEKEANMFASRILMPMLLLKELDIQTAEELSALCDVSIESAKFRLKRYNEIDGRNKFYTNPNEILLLGKLKNFIDNYKKENK